MENVDKSKLVDFLRQSGRKLRRNDTWYARFKLDDKLSVGLQYGLWGQPYLVASVDVTNSGVKYLPDNHPKKNGEDIDTKVYVKKGEEEKAATELLAIYNSLKDFEFDGEGNVIDKHKDKAIKESSQYTKNINRNKLVGFLKSITAALDSGDATCGEFPLYHPLVIAVGPCTDTDERLFVAGIVVPLSYMMNTDYELDYITPYYSDSGEALDTEITFAPGEEEKAADRLIKIYDDIKDLDIGEDGEVLEDVPNIENEGYNDTYDVELVCDDGNAYQFESFNTLNEAYGFATKYLKNNNIRKNEKLTIVPSKTKKRLIISK